MLPIKMIAVSVLACVAFPAPTYAAETFDFDGILATLRSGNEALACDGTSEGIAQEQLNSELDRLVLEGDSAKLESLVSMIIDEIEVAEDPVVCALADILGDMVPSWRASDHERAKNRLYGAMQAAEANRDVRDALDHALMNAEGLYFDAIDDYSDDLVDDIEGTAQKFRDVFTSFPDSHWAASAHVYLARYYTRAFFLEADHPLSMLDQAKETYADFEQSLGVYEETDGIESEAYYYAALNSALLGDMPAAKGWLERIEDWLGDEVGEIYVDCLFRGFGEFCQGTIDDFVDAGFLTSVTHKAFDDVGAADPQDTEGLAFWMDSLVQEVLGALEATAGYVVIAGTAKGDEEAEALVQDLNGILDQSDTDLMAEIYAPDEASEYKAVVIKKRGDNTIEFSRDDADDVRARALSVDLPEAPYLWETE